MDLRSGTFYWPTLTPAPDFAPIDRDLSCDVAVVGGGVTGALVALHMVEAGISTVVVDRRDVVQGSTAASTGLLQYEIDVPLTELERRIGPDRARRAYRVSAASLGWIRELVARLDDDCGLVRRPSLYLGCEPDDEGELRAEHAARQAIGLDVEFLSSREIERTYGFARPAAIRSADAMEVDPYRLTIAILRRAVALGVVVHARTQVDSYTADETGVTLATHLGPRVRARHVAFATGYETPEFFDRDICRLRSTYAVTSALLSLPASWRDRCLIWESGDPYFYARTTPDGRVIFGGEDDAFADAGRRDARIEEKARNLAAKLNRLFPSMCIAPEFAWAGTFAETADGLPYIGTTPTFPRGLFALGYGGNGITFSVIAARTLLGLSSSRKSLYTGLFRFDR